MKILQKNLQKIVRSFRN